MPIMKYNLSKPVRVCHVCADLLTLSAHPGKRKCIDDAIQELQQTVDKFNKEKETLESESEAVWGDEEWGADCWPGNEVVEKVRKRKHNETKESSTCLKLKGFKKSQTNYKTIQDALDRKGIKKFDIKSIQHNMEQKEAVVTFRYGQSSKYSPLIGHPQEGVSGRDGATGRA